MNKSNSHLFTGELVSIQYAAEQLAKIDHSKPDILWVLRFCINEMIKPAIRLPEEHFFLRFNQVLPFGESCGKCHEISDAVEIARLNDEEHEAPDFCDNCYMTLKPIMGLCKDVHRLSGVFFIHLDNLNHILSTDSKTAPIHSFFIENKEWKFGLEPIYMTTPEAGLKYFDGHLSDKEIEIIETQNKARLKQGHLMIHASDIFLWKQHFEDAINQKGKEDRAESPIAKPISGKPETTDYWIQQTLESWGVDMSKPLEKGVIAKLKKHAENENLAVGAETIRKRLTHLGMKSEHNTRK